MGRYQSRGFSVNRRLPDKILPLLRFSWSFRDSREVRARVLSLAGLGLGLVLAGAAAAGTPVPKHSAVRAGLTSGKARERALKIKGFADRWLGTPYLWGGTTKTGVDCSGYAREMFRELFRAELPRTTSQQIYTGQAVHLSPSALGAGFEPGDLFFYVDRVGVPNHVVVYIGDGKFTHSASGRGVVVEGWKALYGRRIVGRRVLLPASKGGSGGPSEQLPYIPAAGPLAGAVEVPCPPSYRARPEHLASYRSRPISSVGALGLVEICEWKALRAGLTERGGPAVAGNVAKIDAQIEWMESLDFLKDVMDQ